MTETNGTSQQYAGWQRQELPAGVTSEQLRFLERMMVANDMPAYLSRTMSIFGDLINRGNRNLEEECGYPANTESISPEYYRTLYDREPIANRICQLMPKECWQLTPEVYEEEEGEVQTDFEQDWDDVGRNLSPSGKSWHQDERGSSIWEYLSRIDVLSGIGQFGVLLLGIDDGKNLQDAVDGVEVVVNGEWIPDSPPSNMGVFVRDQQPVTLNKEDAPPRGAWTTELQQREIDAASGCLPNQTLDSLARSDRQQQHYAERYGRAVQNRRYYLRAIQRGQHHAASIIANKAPYDDTVLNAAVRNKMAAKTSNGTSLGGATPPNGPFVQGSDAQYGHTMESGLGMAMPAGASLSGTDQQYFGIQFGPSQRFADTPPKDRRKLLFMRCFDESLVQVVRYEWNIRNPRFGLPVMYRITLNDPRQPHSGVGLPLATVYVHWSRVIHVADNLHCSEIFGVPRMRPNLNRILDLRKIYAADGEGYWRNAFTIVSAETHPQLGGDVLLDESKIKDEFQRLFHGLQRQMVTKGMSLKTLAPVVTDPTPHIAVQLEAICIQLGCPIRVFKGSERGELASGQDDEAWNERKRERQLNYLTPKVIVPLVDRLIQLGVLSLPQKKAKKLAKPPEPEGRLTPPPADQPAPAKKVPPAQEPDDGPAGAGSPGGGAAADNPGGTPKGNPAVGGKPAGTAPPIAGAKPIGPANNRRWIVVNRGQTPILRRLDRLRGATLIVNDDGKPLGVQTDGGYSVEWPDLDALGDKDKAAICLQSTQAAGAYVSGNVESLIHPMDWLTSKKFMGMDPEEAKAMLGATVKSQEQQESIHHDMADEHGMPPAPPPGFQDKPPPPPVIIGAAGASKSVMPGAKPPVGTGKPPVGNVGQSGVASDGRS